MSGIHRSITFAALGLALACLFITTPASARPPAPPVDRPALQGPTDGKGLMLCRLADEVRRRDLRLAGPILRINRVYLRGRYVIVELKRHTNELLTDNDYRGSRVTVTAHPSGAPYHQVNLGDLDRLRNLNTAVRVMNWITPLQLDERTAVTAKLRFRGQLYTKTVTLTPPPTLAPTRVRQPPATIRVPPTTR